MKLGPFLAVLVALLCAASSTYGEPFKQTDVDTIPAGTRINPRFYVKVDSPRSISASGEEEDDITAEEEAELAEDEEDDNDDEDDPIETYYPVSDDSGQTYLIPESVLQVMADKQDANDDSDTYLVPNGSVRLDDDDSEDGESSSAIILSEGADDNALVDGSQYIAIVHEPESYGKSRRVRRGGIVRRRRAGGRRRRRRRGGSRQGLKRRRTRRRIQRGGGARGGRRRRRGGGGKVRLGRIRLRPRRGFRF